MNMPAPKELIGKVMSVLRYGDRLNPSRDWLVLLAIFLLVFIGSVTWNMVSLFQTLSKDPTSYVNTVTTTVEKDAIESLKDVLKERGREKGVRESDATFVDPSGE